MTKITHEGQITLHGFEIPCYVTEDGTRLLASRRMQSALKIVEETTKSGGQVSGTRMDRFFNQKSLQPLFNSIKDRTLLEPIEAKFGKRKIIGYNAKILPDICNLMLKGRRQGLIKGSRQIIIAEQCEILLSAFATIGITALIDEATGYQDIRKRDALQKILDAYLSKELSAWAKRFPDDFYQEIFRLKNWDWDFKKRKPIVGKYTNDIVYDRLAPKLVEELKKKNPKDNKGRRKNHHHRWLTTDIGHPALSQHIYAVTGLMRTCQTWDQFKRLINRAFPKKGDQMDFLAD